MSYETECNELLSWRQKEEKKIYEKYPYTGGRDSLALKKCKPIKIQFHKQLKEIKAKYGK